MKGAKTEIDRMYQSIKTFNDLMYAQGYATACYDCEQISSEELYNYYFGQPSKDAKVAIRENKS